MWTEFLEASNPIRAIYSEVDPSLDNIFLHEIKIVNGEDIQCYIRFDLSALPAQMPIKWQKKGFNAVQIDMALISARVITFNISGNETVGNIEIGGSKDGLKTIVFKAKEREVFEIQSQWISIRSINGYCKE